jgi:hypothetical protein
MIPTTKLFNITHKQYTFDKIRAEVDKCILLCKECHAEHHKKEKMAHQAINYAMMFAQVS